MPKIPLVDLQQQYREHRADFLRVIDEVCASASFIQGPHLKRFEASFVGRIGATHGIGCSSGTSALSLILEAMGIGRGDEVITVANSFFATAEAICNVGAVPVFVDVDAVTYTIDPQAAAAAVTPRTRAVLAVHLYGTPCDMGALSALCQRHGLALIEDAAQAHLATYRGAYAGTLGDAAGFSFYPGKNLGAFGDAGFVTARDDAMAQRVRKLRDHGRSSKYEHDVIGYNHRMDALQAAVLQVKLDYLDEWTAARRRHAAAYDTRIAAAGFQVMQAPEEAEGSYHLYVVQVSNRAEVQAVLADAGIATGIHYPVPLHRQPALAHLGIPEGALPVTERQAQRVLSLPLYPEMTSEQRDRVATAFLAVARP